MISLLHTVSQDTAETQDEEEVVQEDLIVLQSNLPISDVTCWAVALRD